VRAGRVPRGPLVRLVSHSLTALEKAGNELGKALVVVISSMVGVEPQPGVVPYGMSKAAQRALCAGAHLECAQRGIQFTAISPALVDTPGAAWSAADGKPAAEDVAQAVRFLLSTSTNCYVPELQLRGAGPFRAVLPQEQLFVNAMPRIPRRTASVGLSRLGNC
jgi:NAD(P)-dependent dehydrogenase (short-subunit alcohol dehydrogenase family)